jgi:hypothetical protein
LTSQARARHARVARSGSGLAAAPRKRTKALAAGCASAHTPARARCAAVIMLVCRFVGILFKAAGQPTVIGEIIAGASARAQMLLSAPRRHAAAAGPHALPPPARAGRGMQHARGVGVRTRTAAPVAQCSAAAAAPLSWLRGAEWGPLGATAHAAPPARAAR